MALTRRAFFGRLALGAAVATLSTEQVIDALTQQALAAPAPQPAMPVFDKEAIVVTADPKLKLDDEGAVFSRETIFEMWSDNRPMKRYIIGVTLSFTDGSKVEYKPINPIEWREDGLTRLLRGARHIRSAESRTGPATLKVAYVTEQFNSVIGPDGRSVPVYSQAAGLEPLEPISKADLRQFAHAIVVEAQSVDECITMAEQTAAPRPDYTYADKGWIQYRDERGPKLEFLGPHSPPRFSWKALDGE